MKKYDMLKEYLNVFEEENNKPIFLNKYYDSKILKRIKYVSVYCGCDYTNLYKPLFMYSRFYHGLVVANMTWHFTRNKKYGNVKTIKKI